MDENAFPPMLPVCDLSHELLNDLMVVVDACDLRMQTTSMH
jgi:hypothetical protein